VVRNRLAHQTNACARSSLRFSLFSAVLLLVANVSLFAPYVVYRSNPEEFEVGFIDMLGQMLWLDIGILTVILLPGMLVSTALRARLIGAVFALGLLTWLQSSVLLWDYGVFDGREVDWSGMDWLGWLDIAIWSVALVAAIRFSAKLLPAVNTTVWVLIVGQLIVLIVERPSVPGYWQRTPVLSWPEALGDLSADHNIFHFILDSFQSDVFLELVEEQGAAGDFNGFTLFYENAGVSPHTAFAVPATLLGRAYDAERAPSEFFRQAMTEGVPSRLFDLGFTVNLVPLLSMPEARRTNYYEIPSAYQNSVQELAIANTAQLLDVGLFRVAPHFLRKILYDNGNWWLLARYRGDVKPASFQDKAFLADYIERLNVAGEVPAYHFMHLNPPHPPYMTLADGRYAGRVLKNTRENYLNEARAIFKQLLQFIGKLKALGLYESSLIIFQGDHGSQIAPIVDGEPIKPCVIRLPAMLAVKPSDGPDRSLQISSAPSSLLDVAPTILAAAGATGRSIFDLDPQAARSRPFQLLDDSGEETRLLSYVIEGSVFDPGACRLAETRGVRLEAATHLYGSVLRFGMTGNSDAIKGSGWSYCGAEHCWTNGPSAALNLNVPDSGVDHVLSLQFMPFLSDPAVPRQRIGVSVNGELLAEWNADSPEIQTRSLRIPARLIPGQALRVELSLPDSASPKAVGAGGDVRELGIAMLSLELERAEP